MSWSGTVPETPAEAIDGAIDSCVTEPTEAELSNPQKAQLAAARSAAHALVNAGVVKGDSFEILLGGHADPGDGSTQPDYLHAQVTQRRTATTAAAAAVVDVGSEA